MSNQKAGLLYRKCLKWLKVQGLGFDDLCAQARCIRNEFEEHRGETDPSKIQFLVDRTEFWLNELEPAIPYTIPEFPGGSSWLRNPQLDMDYVKTHSGIYDFEKERDAKYIKYQNLYKNK